MIKSVFSKPNIFIPRLQKLPVDSYAFNQLFSKKIYSPGLIKKEVPIFINKIRNFVMSETGHDPLNEMGNQHGEYVTSRQLFMYFVRKYVKDINGKKYSQKKTGELVGKDHSTCIHAEKCVEKFYDTELTYRNMYNRIDTSINSLI
jgi:hypothetical protein